MLERTIRRLLDTFASRPRALAWLLAGLLAPATAAAQTPLSLDDAMRRAREAHTDARAADATVREATEGVSVAGSAFYPTVDVVQSWQRGNQPVFVFGSLLAQRRFTAQNFAIGALNHPGAVNNYRSAVVVEQQLFDGGLTRAAVDGATLGRDMAEATRARLRQDLAIAAALAYTRVAHLSAVEEARRHAVEAAESDAARARERRDAGVVTEADVLSAGVHAARTRADLLETTGDLVVARAELNQAIGAPLDARFDVMLLEPPRPSQEDLGALEQEALAARPEARETLIASALAANGARRARAAYLPQVGLQGGVETNGSTLAGPASSWVMGVEVRLNLFRGFADRARVAAARESETRQDAERDGVERAIRLDVRSAVTRLGTARARVDVGQAALEQARESQRILRDRYENGRATMTDVLEAARAVSQAEADAIAARVDVVLRAVALDRARGRL